MTNKTLLIIVSLSIFFVLDSVKANPCKLITPISYYVRYPSNMKKYIECSPSGEATVKTCEKDHEYFDMLIGICRRVISDLEEKHILETTCENDGLYTHIIYGAFRCVCDPTKFTGDRCEKNVSNLYRYENHNLTTADEILAERFCIIDYRKHVLEKDIQRNITYYEEKFNKYNFTDEVYDKIEEYIKTYENDTNPRYEIMLESLYNDVLKTVFPEANFCRDSYNEITHDNKTHNTNAFEAVIPIALQYGTTAVIRSNEIVLQFNKITRAIITYLRDHVKNIQDDAKLYSDLMVYIMNQNNTEFNDRYFTSGKPYVKDQYDADQFMMNKQRQFSKFFVSIHNFEYIAAKNIAKYGGFDLKSMARDFSECSKAIELVKDMRDSAYDIRETLLNYGFWITTNALVYPELTKKTDL